MYTKNELYEMDKDHLVDTFLMQQNQITKAISDYDFIYNCLQNSKDKLYRRNLQIADLKKKNIYLIKTCEDIMTNDCFLELLEDLKDPSSKMI